MPAGLQMWRDPHVLGGPPTTPCKIKVSSVVLTGTLVDQGAWEGQKLCLIDGTAELDLKVELSSSSATYSVQWILSHYSKEFPVYWIHTSNNFFADVNQCNFITVGDFQELAQFQALTLLW